MEKKIIGLGLLAGMIAGVTCFVFARLQIAPLIAAAIDYEEGRSHAEAAMTGEHGHEHEVFTRAVQENFGSAAGVVAFAVIMGALFAVVLTVVAAALRRHRIDADLRSVATATAAAAFLSASLIPFVAFPSNPPGVGQPGSAGDRTSAYLTLVVVSVALAGTAFAVGLRLAPRLGGWQATVASTFGYVGAAAAAAMFSPRFDETPGPLTDGDGVIQFPGFPADLLAEFRVDSLLTQAIMWSVVGAVFAVLLPRVTARSLEAAHAGR
jgi:predicted cobalt transporter CbtA